MYRLNDNDFIDMKLYSEIKNTIDDIIKKAKIDGFYDPILLVNLVLKLEKQNKPKSIADSLTFLIENKNDKTEQMFIINCCDEKISIPVQKELVKTCRFLKHFPELKARQNNGEVYVIDPIIYTQCQTCGLKTRKQSQKEKCTHKTCNHIPGEYGRDDRYRVYAEYACCKCGVKLCPVCRKNIGWYDGKYCGLPCAAYCDEIDEGTWSKTHNDGDFPDPEIHTQERCNRADAEYDNAIGKCAFCSNDIEVADKLVMESCGSNLILCKKCNKN